MGPGAHLPAHQVARRCSRCMENMKLGAKHQRGEELLGQPVPAPVAIAGRRRSRTRRDGAARAASSSTPRRRTSRRALSGGQRKLLEMARALMSDPTLVMLDEPMAGVNPALTQSLLDHILDLKDQGMTVLFVEHDMHMVRHIADWVVVMAEGRVVAEGPTRRRSWRTPPSSTPTWAPTRTLDLGVVTGRIHVDRGRPRRQTPARQIEAEAEAELAESLRRAETTEEGRQVTAPDRARTPSSSTMKDVHAGYLPGVNILNGANLVARAGRAHRHHRPQRRRQVDAAEGDLRPGERAQRHHHV